MNWRVSLLTFLFTLPVTAQAAHCSIQSELLAFGEYDTFYPGPLDSSSAVTVQCDNVAPFRITLDAGMHSAGGVMQRQMRSENGSDPLMYNLFLDSARSVVWGDGSAGTDVYTSTGNLNERVTIYGRIPPAQKVSPGMYSDAVLISVDW